jgi:hypothetical protein
MLVRRVLLEVEIHDDHHFMGQAVRFNIPGINQLYINESRGDSESNIFTLDGILLSWEEKRKWLKANLNNTFWVRVTGILEVSGFIDGFYERNDGDPVHTPTWEHTLTLIAIEVLSDFQLNETTAADE